MKDYYSILGVNRNTNKEDIKKAYKKLVGQYHPDINRSPEAEERMKEINIAYEELMKPKPLYKDNFFRDSYFNSAFVFMKDIEFGKNISNSTLTIDFSEALQDEDISNILKEIHKLGIKIIGHSYICKSGVS